MAATRRTFPFNISFTENNKRDNFNPNHSHTSERRLELHPNWVGNLDRELDPAAFTAFIAPTPTHLTLDGTLE